MKEYKNRAEVPEKYKMNLEEYFSSTEDFLKHFEMVEQRLPSLSAFQGKLKASEELVHFLETYISLSNIMENLYVYSYISHDLDMANEELTMRKNKVEGLYAGFQMATAFFVPEIVKMEESDYQKLWENEGLHKYRFLLDEIYKEKEHTLSEEAEKLIGILGETYSSYENISSTLLNSEHHYGFVTLEHGEKVNIVPNNLRSLKRNSEERVRKHTHKKFGKVVQQYQNTESGLLHYYVKNLCNLAKVRNFASAWEKKLHEIHLPNVVFENLKSVAKDRKRAWQKYYQLMKKELNLKTLHGYDTLVEWNPSIKEYSIEDAESLILNALQILGPNYISKLKKVFDRHYIDYCAYKGKVSGGYSFGTSTQNSRIVLSFHNQYSDILTIAHEAGHNVHHQYVNESNDPCYRSTSSFTAEIASLTNEFLLNHYMSLHAKTKQEKLVSIEYTLKTFQTNFFGAIMEGEMEQKMYDHVLNGGMITASFLNDLAKTSLKEYQGSVVKQDEYSYLMWVTRSHYYMNFYLYSYSICVSIAAAFALKIIHQEEGIISKYEEFLQSGSNMHLEEIYGKLGIDIREKSVFMNAVDFFLEQIEEYEKIKETGGSDE